MAARTQIQCAPRRRRVVREQAPEITPATLDESALLDTTETVLERIEAVLGR